MSLTPYLNFGGNCREAFTRYHEIFGGELEIMRIGDAPPMGDEPLPPEMADRTMHAALKWGDNLLLASDSMPGEFGPVQYMYASYTADDAEEAARVFEQLAEGGTVEMPYGPTFWAPGFGVCVDRFGTPWMISAPH